MNLNLRNLVIALTLLVGTNIQAARSINEAPLLAKVTRTPPQIFPGARGKVFATSVFEIMEDGRVFLTQKYLQQGAYRKKRTFILYYREDDIKRFKLSIESLDPSRALVETNAPIVCDAGSTVYSVVLQGKETTLQEKNDCRASRVRARRSQLEVHVIQVLDHMLAAYYKR